MINFFKIFSYTQDIKKNKSLLETLSSVIFEAHWGFCAPKTKGTEGRTWLNTLLLGTESSASALWSSPTAKPGYVLLFIFLNVFKLS